MVYYIQKKVTHAFKSQLPKEYVKHVYWKFNSMQICLAADYYTPTLTSITTMSSGQWQLNESVTMPQNLLSVVVKMIQVCNNWDWNVVIKDRRPLAIFNKKFNRIYEFVPPRK